MNPLSYEAELWLLAVLLYLYDSSVLLYSNEALLSASGAGWSVELGFTGFLLGGRSLCMLNPFTPQRPAFRLSWNFEGWQPSGDAAWTLLARRLAPLQATTLLSAVALFILLPVGLFSPLGAYVVIPTVAILYGSGIWGLWRLRRLRPLLGLAATRYAGFAFECLACPPFAANMVRRLALLQRVDESLPAAGARLLPKAQWQRLSAHCEARLEGEIQALDLGSAARARLEDSKRTLKALATDR